MILDNSEYVKSIVDEIHYLLFELRDLRIELRKLFNLGVRKSHFNIYMNTQIFKIKSEVDNLIKCVSSYYNGDVKDLHDLMSLQHKRSLHTLMGKVVVEPSISRKKIRHPNKSNEGKE